MLGNIHFRYLCFIIVTFKVNKLIFLTLKPFLSFRPQNCPNFRKIQDPSDFRIRKLAISNFLIEKIKKATKAHQFVLLYFKD